MFIDYFTGSKKALYLLLALTEGPHTFYKL